VKKKLKKVKLKAVEIFADSVPPEKWKELVYGISEFCKKSGIALKGYLEKKKGEKRTTKIFFEKKDAEKVDKYLTRALLGR